MSYVIEVNEGVIEATRQGASWWFPRRRMFEAAGKLRETKLACVIGGTVELGPYDRDDAEFMADHMITSGGMPPTAVKVKRSDRPDRVPA